jgi:hypothetical protein
MTVAAGTWLQTVDFSIDFPGESLVRVGIVKESPFRRALRIDDLSQCSAFYGAQQHGYHGGARALIGWLAESEKVLVNEGPEAVAKIWRAELGPTQDEKQSVAPISIRKYEQGGYNYGRSDGHWSNRGDVPNMIGLTPVSAGLYLAAIGLSDQPVPISFARALLEPRYEFPANLAELCSQKAPTESMLHTLWIDGDHRLVILEKPVRVGYDGRAVTDGKTEPVHVLSEGWRLLHTPIFLGYPADKIEGTGRESQPWQFDHDGPRLVRLHSDERRPAPEAAIPVVELSEIVPDLVALFNDVRADPAKMLELEHREKTWTERRAAVSPVARRIVETALREFSPWPFPFRRRTDAELRLRTQESSDAVIALFDRLLDAPGPLRPTDLTAYFFSLITKRRAEFAAWPEDFVGVWGFKIKTGDHNWINGRIWHEPGEKDDPADPVEFEASAAQIETTRYRDRYRHRVHLWTGSLCCYIERDDT